MASSLVATGIQFPDSSIQTTAADKGPAFSAYLNSSQTLTSATFTKLQINIEEFDTASAYDNATNYRFQPAVAGYYQVNGGMLGIATLASQVMCTLYKNGTVYKRGSSLNITTTLSGQFESITSAVVYLNGSIDYIELYGYIAASSGISAYGASGDPAYTYFQASMVRAA